MDLTAIDAHIRPHFDHSALVVIDMQVDFLDGGAAAVAGTTAVLPALARLVGAYRKAGRPIVHVVRLHVGDDVDLVRRTPIVDGGADVVRPGSPGSQIAPQLLADTVLRPEDLLAGHIQEVGSCESVIWKPRWSAFHRTRLDEHLTQLGVDTVVFAGCNFPNCPRASMFDASERDYRVVVAIDATSQVTAERLADARSIGAVGLDTDTIVAEVAGELPVVHPVVSLFSYGTLKYPNVQLETFGRHLDGHADALVGYTTNIVTITDPEVLARSGVAEHPIVVPSTDTSDRVEGMVFEITEAELAAADDYEVDDYARVKATSASGTEVWVYLDALSRR